MKPADGPRVRGEAPLELAASRVSSWSSDVLLSLGGLVILGIVWQVAVMAELTSVAVLPPPGDVFTALVEFRGPIATAASTTLAEVLWAFALAAVFGLVLGAGLTYFKTFRTMAYPPLLALYSIPKVALAPLLLIWLGFGLPSRVAVAFLMAFFPVVVEVSAGLRSVDPELHDLARTLHASGPRTFFKIDLPSAMPSYLASLKVAVTLVVIGAIIGEFVAAQSGLGYLLQSAVSQQSMDLAVAITFVISMLSIVLFGLVSLLDRRVAPWARGQDHSL